MSESIPNYIQKNIESLEKSKKDLFLASTMERELIFFENNDYSKFWVERLQYFEEVDFQGYFIIEAVFHFGIWRIENQFPEIEKSIDLFEKSEYQAIEQNWFRILILSIKYQKSLCYQFNKKEKLSFLSKRIFNYINDMNEILPTITILDLTNQLIDVLDYLTKEEISELYEIIYLYSENEKLHYSLRYRFYEALISLRKYEKRENEVKELHKKVLTLKILEAEEKGNSSNIILARLLEDALDYCINYVSDRDMIESLKKRINKIDYSDEFIKLELPENMIKEMEESYKKYDELVKNDVKNYISILKGRHPFEILYNVLNDESLFNMRIEYTKDYTKNIFDDSIAHIFTKRVDLPHKRVTLNSDEEKLQADLHTNLSRIIPDIIQLINYIFIELESQCKISIEDIYHFLGNCKLIKPNDHQMIIWSILRHYDEDYLSSIAILLPKLESALYYYLEDIGADITTYESGNLGQRTLGGLLELKEVETHFSIDFQYFMRLLLTAEDGTNYRNRHAHGSTTVNEYNKSTSTLVIFLILKIYAKSFLIPARKT